jgi:tripartite-type tricarboxylate transporter receptor subunit TctC
VVARAAPDGYTLVMSDRSALAVAPHLQKSLPYDVEKDFAPISLVALAPPILVVHPAFPAHTLRALMAYVREHPGEVSYASAGPGTATHVAAELLKHLAQLDMVAVHYKGGGAAIAAIVSGEVPVGTALVPAVLPHIKSGRVRPLAVAADKRFAGLPEIPTAAQAGLAGFESQFWIGLLAPARTPGPLVSRLNADVGAVLRTEEFRAVLLSQGADAAPGTPAEFAQLIRTEMQRMKNLVALTRMRAD